MAKISDHLHLTPRTVENAVESRELQAVLGALKPFSSNEEIMEYFEKDNGLEVRLKALGYRINVLTKRTDLQMKTFTRLLVSDLFARDYQLTHAWRLAEGEGERYVNSIFLLFSIFS